MVNAAILDNRSVQTTIQDIESAKKGGAMALFGEKYSEQVRVVQVKDFSLELCGGTHVQATGELGLFKIISESSIAAGIRRIEAITGFAAIDYVHSLQDGFARFASKLHSPLSSVETKLDSLMEHATLLETQLKAMQAKAGESFVNELLQKATDHGAYRLICYQTDMVNLEEFKQLADTLKSKLIKCIAVLFNLADDKLNILCVVSADLTAKYHAGKIVAQLATLLDGKGGGRPDSAMAGGKALAKVPEVMAQVPDLINSL
jgi:alanyl-tRNA synthetase